MKIQYLAIIFLIIILPMTLVLTMYNQSQINNLDLQLQYRTYLSDATHDAIKAFELNTVNNTYADVADSLKRDIEAAVNVFLNSMASKLGTSGATPEAISEYVPALLFTLYDGYYIYAPSYSEELKEVKTRKEDTDGIQKDVVVTQSQNPKVENFSHIVKPFVYYTMRYNPSENNEKSNKTDFIVNYTLDNYITIYGKINGEYVTKSGYLLEQDANNNIANVTVDIDQEKLLTVLRRDVLSYKLGIRDLDNATLTEINTWFNDNFSGLKNYIDTSENGSYRTSLVSSMGETLLNYVLEGKSWNSANPSKKAEIKLADIPISKIEEVFANEVTHIGNIDEVIDCFNVTYKKGTVNQKSITDRDAKLYYIKALQFTNWVNKDTNPLSKIQIQDAIDSKGKPIAEFEGKTEKIFNTKTNSNNPEDLKSPFAQHKIEVIKQSIQSNLTSAIARYNQIDFALTHGYDLKMPVLNDLEWETISNKVTMVSFMQGMIIGNKVFNDYSVVSSNNNDEVVDIEQMYYFNRKASGVTSYHKFDCPNLLNEAKKGNSDIVAYKAVEYELYKTKQDDKIKYQVGDDIAKDIFVIEEDEYGREIITSNFKPNGITNLLLDYDCLVNCNYKSEDVDNEKLLFAKIVAIGRERNQHYKINSYMDTVIN